MNRATEEIELVKNEMRNVVTHWTIYHNDLEESLTKETKGMKYFLSKRLTWVRSFMVDLHSFFKDFINVAPSEISDITDDILYDIHLDGSESESDYEEE